MNCCDVGRDEMVDTGRRRDVTGGVAPSLLSSVDDIIAPWLQRQQFVAEMRWLNWWRNWRLNRQ